MDNKTKKQLLIAQGFAIGHFTNNRYIISKAQDSSEDRISGFLNIQLFRVIPIVNLRDPKRPKKQLTVEQLLEDGFGQLKSKKKCIKILNDPKWKDLSLNSNKLIHCGRTVKIVSIADPDFKNCVNTIHYDTFSGENWTWTWPVECFEK